MTPVTVAVVGSRVEAELLVGMLRSRGIKARISADDAGGVDPALQAQGVRVLVGAGDADKARRLVERMPEASGRPNPLQRWLIRLLNAGSSRGR